MDYSVYNALSTGLAQKPDGCAIYENCSALPDDDYYWLNGLIQWDCEWNNYSTTYGSSSCGAFIVYRGDVSYDGRDYDGRAYALCE